VSDFDSSAEDLPAAHPRPRPYVEPEPDRAPVREGLPPTYRMRADRHYVDLLASRGPVGRERTLPVSSFEAPGVTDVPALVPLIESIRAHGILQPLLVQDHNGTMRVVAGHRRLAAAIAAGLREVPCIVHDVDDETAGRLREASNLPRAAAESPQPVATVPPLHADDEIGRAFSTVSGLADLMTGSLSDLTRGVVGTLLRAELWRAAHLQQATRVLRDDAPVTRTAVAAAGLVERVVQGFGPERRIRHVELITTSDVPPGHVIVVDERLATTGLTGAILATLALLEGLPACRVTVSLAMTATRAVSLTVSQEHVRPSGTWVERAFDRTWRDRPGGLPVLVSMAAMQQAALVHGGDAIAVASARGSRLALTIAAGA
jgi:hypothetical protein